MAIATIHAPTRPASQHAASQCAADDHRRGGWPMRLPVPGTPAHRRPDEPATGDSDTESPDRHVQDAAQQGGQDRDHDRRHEPQEQPASQPWTLHDRDRPDRCDTGHQEAGPGAVVGRHRAGSRLHSSR